MVLVKLGKEKDANGNTVLDGVEPVLEEVYSVKTGTVLAINTKKNLYNGDLELCDISAAFTPQKMEFMRN